jgi:hypothetical protein
MLHHRYWYDTGLPDTDTYGGEIPAYGATVLYCKTKNKSGHPDKAAKKKRGYRAFILFGAVGRPVSNPQTPVCITCINTSSLKLPSTVAVLCIIL